MLHYRLVKNNLVTGSPEDRLARPVDVPVRTRQDLIRDITRPGSILKPTESEAVIGDYWGKITDYARRGEAYSDDHIRIGFSFRGLYPGDEDQFDPERHELIISSALKNAITGVAAEVPLRKVDGGRIVPEIEYIYDWGSQTRNDRLTPGDVLEIAGADLKIYDHLEEEGVFFVSPDDGTEHRSPQLRINEPKALVLRIPEALAPGSWRLQVRNTSRRGTTLRNGVFNPVLRVE